MPVRQWYIGAVRVVGRQDAADHGEEIHQSPCFDRCLDGRCAVAFADHIVAHVRMRYGVVSCRRVRIDGRHIVRHLLIQLAQTVQIQRNPKPPQIDVLQGNRFRDYAQGIFLAVEFDVIELLLQRPQVCGDRRESRHLSVSPVQKRLDVGSQEWDLTQLPVNRLTGVFGRRNPVAGHSRREPSGIADQVPYRTGEQAQLRCAPRVAALAQLLQSVLDSRRDAHQFLIIHDGSFQMAKGTCPPQADRCPW